MISDTEPGPAINSPMPTPTRPRHSVVKDVAQPQEMVMTPQMQAPTAIVTLRFTRSTSTPAKRPRIAQATTKAAPITMLICVSVR